MEQHLARLVEHAPVHGSGVQIDASVAPGAILPSQEYDAQKIDSGLEKVQDSDCGIPNSGEDQD